MARPKTATNILEARGAFDKNPNRARPNEPKSAKEFRKSAPKHLTPFERSCWKEIRKAVPAGVLTGSDELMVEIVAVLLAEFRTNRTEMSAAYATRMTTQMGRLGLDPSGRAGLVADTPKTNAFDDV